MTVLDSPDATLSEIVLDLPGAGCSGSRAFRSPTVAIAVPVRDEAARLPRLLAALAGQRDVVPGAVAIALLLDGCVDGSEALARGWNGPFDTRIDRLPPAEPNAGRARRAAMAMAEATGAGLLLTTDADSVPAPDWIAAAVRALAGADVVAGRIVRRRPEADPGLGPGPGPGLQDRVERYYDRLHAHRRALDPVGWDPLPGHHCTGGANLGFRADAYRALGGFDARPSGEDALIVDRAHRAGMRVRREPAMLVETSPRRHGRAPGGLAHALAALDRTGEALVAHPADAAWQYRAQARARAAFPALAAGAGASLADALGLPLAEVHAVAAASTNAEAFAMRLAPPVPGGPRTVTLAEAEAALDGLERAGCAA